MQRTSVDILVDAGGRTIDLRASGQVMTFDGFLALYNESKDEEGDEDEGRLPRMEKGESLTKKAIAATQHFTEPPPRYSEATLVKRMEELGIGRPSTYAATLTVLRDREYVRLDKKRLVPEDKGRLVTAFLQSFFARYVEYDFTADLEEKLDQISAGEIAWKDVLREFWQRFSADVGETKELRVTQVLDALNELLGPHIFPARADGGDPRACPSCGAGKLSLKLGKFGAFIGCSNYPECRFTRQLVASGDDATPGENGENGSALYHITIGESDAWGQGYGTEATQLMLDHAFGTLGLHRIALYVFEFNERAIRAYKRCGFVVEGRSRESIWRDGRWWDEMAMSVLESDWRARRDGLAAAARPGIGASADAPGGDPIKVGSSERSARSLGRWR